MEKILPVYMKMLDDNKYLISNRLCKFEIISEEELNELKEQKKKQDIDSDYILDFKDQELREKLMRKYFIIDDQKLNQYSKIYMAQNSGLFHGVGLHIFVLTLECNLNCVYCQAAIENKECHIMSKEVACKAIEIVMSSPENRITIEFQGGEPLLNFDVLKFIVENVESRKSDKEIRFALVNNGQSMTEEKLNFLVEHNVSICFSIDGPKNVHDYNRPTKDGSSNFDNVYFWYKKAQCEYKRRGKMPRVTALPTITRHSLQYAKEIVDFYYNDLNEKTISIRPLSPFGRAEKNWNKICYSSEEFLKFYQECMEIISYNRRNDNSNFSESFSNIILDKLNGKIVNYPDLRSPCGAGTSQIAYNWDGSVYTCDEGRMLSNIGIEKFKAGTVDNTYNELLGSQAVCETCVASCLENHPVCGRCVYHPICGICPVYNYKKQGDLVGNPPQTDKCKIMMGQMEYLIRMIN